MAQKSNQESSTNCLKSRLAATEEKAKAAEFYKQTAATLQELIDKSEKELSNYSSAQSGFLTTWGEQDKNLKEMKRRFE